MTLFRSFLSLGLQDLITAIGISAIAYVVFTIRKPIANVAKYLILSLTQYVTIKISKQAFAFFALRKYATNQLAGIGKYLHIPGQIDVKVEIDRIFVPLVLETLGTNQEFNHTNLFASGNRFQLIGDPGSGKSSVAKRIFRDECNRAIARPRDARFPVLLELKAIPFKSSRFGKPDKDFLFNYIRRKLAESQIHQIAECFDLFSKTNGVVIILDGLDEVATDTYDRAAIAINGLAESLTTIGDKSIILLTMRTQFHIQVKRDYQESLPLVLSLKPFSPTDIYDFLNRWDFSPPETKPSQVLRIYTDLTDRPSLRAMCANPLILSMYVAHDQVSGHPLVPESRTEFYARVTEELLVRRRAAQVGAPAGHAIIREQRQRILGRMAFEHMLDTDQPLNQLSWKTAISITRDIIGVDEVCAENELIALSIDTGIIAEEKERETLRFIHLTFCEYLAAFEAVEGRADGWTMLINAHKSLFITGYRQQRTRLVEVLPFACALMHRHMKNDAVSAVGAIGDDHALALAFLETKAYDHPLWIKYIETKQEVLLRQMELVGDVSWLADVHLFMVLCGDAERAAKIIPKIQNENQLATFFAALSSHDNKIVYSLIDNYAKQDAAAAFRVATLCKLDILETNPDIVIKNLDQPPFFAIVLERALNETGNRTNWICAIVEGALRSKPVENLLNRSQNILLYGEIERINDACKWYCADKVPRTVLTECLSVILNSGASKSGKFPLLNCLRVITAPGARRIDRIIEKCRPYVISLGLLLGIVTILTIDANKNEFWSDLGLAWIRDNVDYLIGIWIIYSVSAIPLLVGASIASGRFNVYRNVIFDLDSARLYRPDLLGFTPKDLMNFTRTEITKEKIGGRLVNVNIMQKVPGGTIKVRYRASLLESNQFESGKYSEIGGHATLGDIDVKSMEVERSQFEMESGFFTDLAFAKQEQEAIASFVTMNPRRSALVLLQQRPHASIVRK